MVGTFTTLMSSSLLHNIQGDRSMLVLYFEEQVL